MHTALKINTARIFLYVSTLILSVYVVFWFVLHFYFSDSVEAVYDFYSDSYGVIALTGSIVGFSVFSLWGGLKSTLGKSLFLFSVGLLFQFLGQVSFIYYRIALGIENPYPSFGEVFYFGSIPIYIYAMWLMFKASSSKKLLTVAKNKIGMVLLPLAMMLFAYFLFLAGYEFEGVGAIVIFLDFGYPLGQAIQISIALLTFIITKNFLGGKLRFAVLSIIVALVLQYVADTVYAVRIIEETWYAGDITDLLYLVSYYSMGLSMYFFATSYTNIKLQAKNE